MNKYSRKQLEDLISCPKVITDPPKKAMYLDRGHWRNGMRLQSADGKYEFSAFMRKNRDFEENFSIGLTYFPKDGTPEITLLRCNGPHGDVVDSPLDPHPHSEHHIHVAKAENIEAGFEPEKGGMITEQYATFEDALGFFLGKCNIVNAADHFPNAIQMKLFNDAEPIS